LRERASMARCSPWLPAAQLLASAVQGSLRAPAKSGICKSVCSVGIRDHARQISASFPASTAGQRLYKSSKIDKILTFKSGAAQGRAVTAGESDAQRETLQVSRQHSTTNQTVGTACIAQAAAMRVCAWASRLQQEYRCTLSNLLP